MKYFCKTLKKAVTPQKQLSSKLLTRMASLYDKLSEADKGKLLCSGLSKNTAPEAIELLRENIDKVNWAWLSCNKSEAAVQLLRENLTKIDIFHLCGNSEAMDLIFTNVLPLIETTYAHLSTHCWYLISANPAAIRLLECMVESNSDKILDKIDWCGLAKNPAAFHLLKNNLHMNRYMCKYLATNTNPDVVNLLRGRLHELNDIGWMEMSYNPAAITILEENLDKVDWNGLSTNPAAIHILKKNIRRVRWGYLSQNPNPEAIDLIESRVKLPKTIDWIELSRNPAAIYFLESHLDKVDLPSLAQNPALFKTEYLIK